MTAHALSTLPSVSTLSFLSIHPELPPSLTSGQPSTSAALCRPGPAPRSAPHCRELPHVRGCIPAVSTRGMCYWKRCPPARDSCACEPSTKDVADTQPGQRSEEDSATLESLQIFLGTISNGACLGAVLSAGRSPRLCC